MSSASRSASAAELPVSAAEAQEIFQPLAHTSALVLAVSGGPDSTALLFLAARWRAARKSKKKPRLVAVTVDHGLRRQSKQEAIAVRRLARRLEVPHRIVRWRGKKPRTGLQEAARAARYRLLAEVAQQEKAKHIVIAHTLDDQAETVLMRMARGSGITGLCGMRGVSPFPFSSSSGQQLSLLLLVRPLLRIPKSRLVATLRHAGIEFADDPSNRDPRFTRPRLRDVIPALAREGLDASRIALLARRLQRAEAALECTVDDACARLSEHARSDGQPIVLAAEKFFCLPGEIALRLLARAINHAGEAGSLRLGKLEALYEALVAAGGGKGGVRRTLAGALITLRGARLSIERAPPRSCR
jgi:tRNA(Ile)-lysidine synthase